MTRHRVLLFARYAELFGDTSVEIDVPDNSTAGDCIDALRATPGGALLPARPLLAVNRTVVAPAFGVRTGDELALLPPLAGG